MGSTRRETMLGGAALLLGGTPVAAKAGKRAIPMIEGALTVKSYETFDEVVMDAIDGTVGLRITLAKAASPAPLVAEAEGGRLTIYRTEPETTSEFIVNGHFRLENGVFHIDGFFRVKGGGVHQGITSAGLMPLDRAKVLAAKPQLTPTAL